MHCTVWNAFHVLIYMLSPCTVPRWWKPSTAQPHKGRKPTPGPHCTDQPYRQGTPRSWKSNHLPRLSRPALLDCLPRFLRPHAGKFPVHRLCKSDHQGGVCSCLSRRLGNLLPRVTSNCQRGSPYTSPPRYCSPSLPEIYPQNMCRIAPRRPRKHCLPDTPYTPSAFLDFRIWRK